MKTLQIVISMLTRIVEPLSKLVSMLQASMHAVRVGFVPSAHKAPSNSKTPPRTRGKDIEAFFLHTITWPHILQYKPMHMTAEPAEPSIGAYVWKPRSIHFYLLQTTVFGDDRRPSPTIIDRRHSPMIVDSRRLAATRRQLHQWSSATGRDCRRSSVNTKLFGAEMVKKSALLNFHTMSPDPFLACVVGQEKGPGTHCPRIHQYFPAKHSGYFSSTWLVSWSSNESGP